MELLRRGAPARIRPATPRLHPANVVATVSQCSLSIHRPERVFPLKKREVYAGSVLTVSARGTRLLQYPPATSPHLCRLQTASHERSPALRAPQPKSPARNPASRSSRRAISGTRAYGKAPPDDIRPRGCRSPRCRRCRGSRPRPPAGSFNRRPSQGCRRRRNPGCRCRRTDEPSPPCRCTTPDHSTLRRRRSFRDRIVVDHSRPRRDIASGSIPSEKPCATALATR